MEFAQPISDLIRARSSKRRYQRRALSLTHQEHLEAILEGAPLGPFASETRFKLMAARDEDLSALKGLGTYGFIKNPSAFIVGAVRTGPKDMEDFGYCMERLILLATEMGLGSCWLGGSFKRSAFTQVIQASSSEEVPAVVSIGYPTDKRGTFDKIVRWSAGSHKRKPWEQLFFSLESGQPLQAEELRSKAEPLEAVRLAPSASNKQPWRIFQDQEETLHFYLSRTPGYGRDMKWIKLSDLQRVDMGIALCHFELSFRAEGGAGAWSLTPPESEPERFEYIASWIPHA